MTPFEFFMAFYGLLLGLAVAELFSGFGNLLRAKSQPRWGSLTPLLGLAIFISIVACFADAWRLMQNLTIDFRSITVPALIGVSLFTASIMAVPKDIDEWPNLDDYFIARRRFTVGALLAVNLLTIFLLELVHVVGTSVPSQIAYWMINALLVGLLVVALLTEKRRSVVASLATFSAVTMLLYFTNANIASWVAYVLNR
jgi:hypothetical protein